VGWGGVGGGEAAQASLNLIPVSHAAVNAAIKSTQGKSTRHRVAAPL
jgi:hypothetical protein